MPIGQHYVDPEAVLEYEGVIVYRTYRDDDIRFPYLYAFTTDKAETDVSSMGCCSRHGAMFNIRLLWSDPANGNGFVNHYLERVPKSVSRSLFLNAKEEQEWKAWKEEGEHQAIIDTLKSAIDAGLIPLVKTATGEKEDSDAG